MTRELWRCLLKSSTPASGAGALAPQQGDTVYVNEYWLGVTSGFIGTFVFMIILSLLMRGTKR